MRQKTTAGYTRLKCDEKVIYNRPCYKLKHTPNKAWL